MQNSKSSMDSLNRKQGKAQIIDKMYDEGDRGVSEPQMHHGGSHHKYMTLKIDKLRRQFISNATTAEKKTSLFHGIAILVDGLTRPSASELKLLMQEHGGSFENYYSRTSVTHIIASNLPDAKVKLYLRERAPPPVVSPAWIVDSIAAGAVLPIQEYILPQLRNVPGQKTLQKFVGTKRKYLESLHPGENARLGKSSGTLPSDIVEPSTKEQPMTESNTGLTDNNNNNDGEVRDDGNGGVKGRDESIKGEDVRHRYDYDPRRLAIAQETAARLRLECDVLKGPPKTSKDDEHFVEHYYKASRLHFIGRWKARLENLMASPSAARGPQPQRVRERVIIHVDMDCFFASVTESSHPEFHGLPLAVCHSNSRRGSGEVSSANYEARKFGVTASMFMAHAKELCPDLIVVPYHFDKYEEVSEQVYRILLKYSSCVQPVSCDEAFMDITGLGDPEEIATLLRREIESTTGCTASAGIGSNMLLARLATKRAKPNGQWFFSSFQAAVDYLHDLEVGDLPGVGWSTGKRLSESGISTISDLRSFGKDRLQSLVGKSAGATLWEFAHGRDDRQVEPPKARKSVGAEINWGVRFESEKDPEEFLANLATEVAHRLHQAKSKGRTITVKVKRAASNWREPAKYLGCGACDNISRSITLANAINSESDIKREGCQLLRSLRIPYKEIRGMGLAVSKLSSCEVIHPHHKDTIESLLARSNAPAVVRSPKRSRLDEDTVSRSVEHRGDGETCEGLPEDGCQPPWTEAGDLQASEVCFASTVAKVNDSAIGNDATARGKTTEYRRQEMVPADHQDSTGYLQRYQGMTLSQVDAQELTRLPWHMQCQIVANIPRHRDKNAIVAAHTTQANDAFVAHSTKADARSSGTHAKGEGPSLQYLRSVGGKQGRESNRERHDCNVPHKREAITHGSRSKESLGASSSCHTIALPSVSQIDPSVLSELPLGVRRELELHYGLNTRKDLLGSDRGHRSLGRGSRIRKGRSNISGKDLVAAGVRRIDAYVARTGAEDSNRDGPVSESTRDGHIKENGYHQVKRMLQNNTASDAGRGLTVSQVDLGVFRELPAEIQREVEMEMYVNGRMGIGSKKRKAIERTGGDEAHERDRFPEGLQRMRDVGVSTSSDENDCWEIGVAHNEDLPAAVGRLIQMAEEGSSESCKPTENDELLSMIEAAIEASASAISSSADPFSARDDRLGDESSIHHASQSQYLARISAAEQRVTDTIHKTSTKSDCDGAVEISHQLPWFQGLEAAIVRLSKTHVLTNVEQLRRLMINLLKLGRRFPACKGLVSQIIHRLQRRACRRYGWPVSLRGL